MPHIPHIGLRQFGWLPDVPDFRDFVFQPPHITLPYAVDLRADGLMPNVWDQGNLGACTSFAICAAYMFEHTKQHLPPFLPSMLFHYFCERMLEGSVNYDSGAYIRDGMKAMNKTGVCSDTVWPYNVTNFRKVPPRSVYDLAKKDRAVRYERVPQTQDGLKTCLAQQQLVILGISVYESFLTEDVSKTGMIPYPSTSEKEVGGHAIALCGYKVINGEVYYILRNSWSKLWGDAGYGYIQEKYVLNANLADDVWCIQLVK